MTAILFIHGWGGSAALWDKVRARLPWFECHAADLGFFGPAHLPAVKRPFVVGHSLGFAWALEHVPQPWAGAVAVNAFPRFAQAPDFPDGVPLRVLDRMRLRFRDQPHAVAADFLTRCGVRTPLLDNMVPERLGAALDFLAVTDQRERLSSLTAPLRILAGEADPIIPPALSHAGFTRRTVEFVAGGGHLLPLTHPVRVAAVIAEMIP